MHLAKPRIDVGLSTNRLDPLLAFWQGEAGARFDHVLPIRRGHDQHRHDVAGSVLKINHHAAPLPASPPTGASTARRWAWRRSGRAPSAPARA